MCHRPRQHLHARVPGVVADLAHVDERDVAPVRRPGGPPVDVALPGMRELADRAARVDEEEGEAVVEGAREHDLRARRPGESVTLLPTVSPPNGVRVQIDDVDVEERPEAVDDLAVEEGDAAARPATRPASSCR